MTTPEIFLSYNREDSDTARRFADAFAAEGLAVWWDTALRSGEAYDEVTEAALRAGKTGRTDCLSKPFLRCDPLRSNQPPARQSSSKEH